MISSLMIFIIMITCKNVYLALWCPLLFHYLLPLEQTCDLSPQWQWSLPLQSRRCYTGRHCCYGGLRSCLALPSAQGWVPNSSKLDMLMTQQWLGHRLPSYHIHQPAPHIAWIKHWLFSWGHQECSFFFPLSVCCPDLFLHLKIVLVTDIWGASLEKPTSMTLGSSLNRLSVGSSLPKLPILGCLCCINNNNKYYNTLISSYFNYCPK